MLELLNMALELNSYLKVPSSEQGEFGRTMRSLMEKYARVRGEKSKGKERERADVPTDAVDADGMDEMSVG